MRGERDSFQVCKDNSHRCLMQWARKCGVKHAKLVPAVFGRTGRGLLASKRLKEGSILISIPKSLLIGQRTLRASPIFKLMTCKAVRLNTLHSICLFIILELRKGNESYFYDYIRTLPRNFSSFSYAGEHWANKLPHDIGIEIETQKNLIKHTLEALNSALCHIPVCDQCLPAFQHSVPLLQTMHEDDVKWAWNVVNTRCVYIDALSWQEERSQSLPKNCMYLVPVLDLLNHDSRAKVESKFNLSTQRFEIITHTEYQRGEQVFINYGEHSNRTLVQEYGFFLRDNVIDDVPIRTQLLLSALTSEEIPNVDQRFSLLQKMSVEWTKLAVCQSAASWNLDKVLKVLITKSCEWKFLEGLLDDSFALSAPQDRLYRSILKNILQHFIEEHAASQRHLSDFKPTPSEKESFEVILALLEHEMALVSLLQGKIFAHDVNTFP